MDAAIAGHGVVLAYSTIAAADLAAGRLVRLFSLALPDLFAYYIVTAPGALERPKVRAFRDWLRHEAELEVGAKPLSRIASRETKRGQASPPSRERVAEAAGRSRVRAARQQCPHPPSAARWALLSRGAGEGFIVARKFFLRTAMQKMTDLIEKLRARLGPAGVLTDPADTDPYCEDWRRLYHGRTPAVLRPASTAEVADAVRLCAEAGVPIVPQGGNTSMVGGAAVAEDAHEIVLSLSRLNRVRGIDPTDMTMEIEAGVPLKSAQAAAAEAGCLLPLSISSEGSAQIGGVLATNAGGNNTVRYGNARDLVLGLEVVLPDGQVWNGLRRLHKDNTGYCLRQLFVGSEGTLGIITAAVLKLFPRPREIEVALCAVVSPEAALDLFNRFQQHDPAAIQAFEYMSGLGMDLVLRHIPGAAVPLAAPAAHYVLIELATPRAGAGLREALEQCSPRRWRRASSPTR